MGRRTIEIFRLWGLPVRADPSWFLLSIFFAVALALGRFPSQYPGLPQRSYWAMGVVTVLGLFASVLAHELAHALTARHFRMPFRSITLFLFWGVTETVEDPPTPAAEMLTALAGPFASFYLACAFGILWLSGFPSEEPVALYGVAGYLSVLNLLLLAFNLMPALPLDGGQAVRALLWQLRGDRGRASLIAGRIGGFFGVALVGLGVALAVGGAIGVGIWLALIGLFLRVVSRFSSQHSHLRASLEGIAVSRVMRRNPPTVPRALSIQEFVDRHLRRAPTTMFAVVDGDRLLGSVEAAQLRGLPQAEWDRQTVGALAKPLAASDTVEPEADAAQTLAEMARSGRNHLLVTEDGRLAGVLSLQDLVGRNLHLRRGD